MTIDEVKRHLFVISDDVLGNDMVDLYEAQECCDTSFIIGYNKALDDFVKFASDMPTVDEEDGTIRPMWLEEIAEQLNVGVKNELLQSEQLQKI